MAGMVPGQSFQWPIQSRHSLSSADETERKYVRDQTADARRPAAGPFV